MLNYLWAFMILVGVVYGLATGRAEALSAAALNSAQNAVTMLFGLLGVYSLWLGLLRIAQAAGLVRSLARALTGALGRLFRGVKRGSEAMGYISLNIVANMLGMGNAATPFGLKAMAELQRLNSGSPRAATDDMCMLLIVNTSSVQLLPLTLIGLRAAAGSANPAEIVIPSLIATTATTLAGIVGAKLCASMRRKRP